MSRPFIPSDIEHVLDVLNHTTTITEAANRLKVNRQTLYTFMDDNGIVKQSVYIQPLRDPHFNQSIRAIPVTDAEGQA